MSSAKFTQRTWWIRKISSELSVETERGNGTDAVVERPSDHCVRRKPVFQRGEASFAEFVSTAKQAFNSAVFSAHKPVR